MVGTVWGQKGSQKYLLDMVRARLSFTASITAIKALAAKYPDYTAIYIEDAANGAAAIDTITKAMKAIIPVRADRSKNSRLMAVAPQFEAGNIFIRKNLCDVLLSRLCCFDSFCCSDYY